jgi:hypothetical protein
VTDDVDCGFGVALWDATQAGGLGGPGRTARVWKYVHPEYQQYATERNALQRPLDPLYCGGAVAALVFVAFRVSNSRWWSARWSDVGRHRQTPTQLPPAQPHVPGTGPPPAAQQQQQSSTTKQAAAGWLRHLDREAERVALAQGDAASLPSDLFVSALVGMSSAAFLFNFSKLKGDVVEAPLLPGKSLIHRHLCPPVQAAFAGAVDREVLREATYAKDESILMFADFVQNCRIRSLYIQRQQQQRQERGATENNSFSLSPERHSNEDGEAMEIVDVVVPFPGLDGIRRKF